MSFSEKLKNAGVVGAGGAGFPTHIKAGSEVEFMLANGAECEPLLHKDVEIMKNFPEEIVNGLKLMMESLNAKKGYFGIKTKNAAAIEAIEPFLKNGNIEMTNLGDFYPSGDEYELVYEATGRLIPPAGIPLDVGCVVNNVETLYNVDRAADDIPVTSSFISVGGAVKNPVSFFAPVGARLGDILEIAGGASVRDFGVFVSGIMMGSLTFDLDTPVKKTTAGFIVLPKDHYLIKRRDRTERNYHRIGKSACDQCSYCTEFCPRYLLGYNVQPHRVMRSLEFTLTGGDFYNQMAELCCACGICTLYACPEDLYPKEACDKAKHEMREKGIKYEQPHPPKVHPMKDARRVPLKQLMKRLKIFELDSPTPFIKDIGNIDEVIIELQHSIGAKAEPTVNEGSAVSKGDLIAKIPEGKLGANLHASIHGTVDEVNEDFIRIKK